MRLNLNIAVSLHFVFFLGGVICIFYSVPLLLLVWILVQQIQITIRLKNKTILLCIEINLKTDKIYSFLFYTRELLTITVHVYKQSYSCSTIVSPFTQSYNKKSCSFCYSFSHLLSLSHSYIFTILSHSCSFLTTFLSNFLYNHIFFQTFYTIIDILFCSTYSLKTFLHATFSYLPPLLLYQIYNNVQFILSIHK